MIADVKEFEKILIDADLNRKQLAERLNMAPSTLSIKIYKPEGDFKLSELLAIARLTHMTEAQFIEVFFKSKLSFN